jgi:hypothetical protein
VSDDSRELKSLCIKLLNRSIINRTIPKQECMVELGRLPLVDCTETICDVSISGSYKVQKLDQQDILSRYKRSNSFQNDTSLYEFFMIQNKQTKDNCSIIPHFIGGSGQPCYPVTENYARSVLLIHKPWCPGNMSGIDGDVIAKFTSFLISTKCPACVKISFERVKARYITKMSHYEAVSGKMVDDGDEIDDNNLDDFTKDILSSVGSLTAKANGCVKTDEGYVFDRGIDHKWDEVVEEVRNQING